MSLLECGLFCTWSDVLFYSIISSCPCQYYALFLMHFLHVCTYDNSMGCDNYQSTCGIIGHRPLINNLIVYTLIVVSLSRSIILWCSDLTTVASNFPCLLPLHGYSKICGAFCNHIQVKCSPNILLAYHINNLHILHTFCNHLQVKHSPHIS